MRIGIVLIAVLGACPAQLADQAVYFTRPGASPRPAGADLGARMSEAIGAARRSVSMAMLRLDLPEVVDALIAAKERGVSVRVLTDDDALALRFAGPFGKLRRAGVAVRGDRGFAFAATSHHKFCVLDGTFLWGGDWNASVGDTTRSEHAAFLVNAPALARAFEVQFDRMWRAEPAGLGSAAISGGQEFPVSGGGVARAHFASAEDLGVVVANQILEAKRTVDVAHTFFTHRRVLMALLEVARRGVRVRVGASFFESPTRVRDACARFGIPFSTGIGPKVVIVDGDRIITGSWNANSGIDHENLVVFRGCPGITEGYGARIDASLKRGRAPYFASPGAASRRPSDRVRDARAASLSRGRASTIAPPDRLEELDVMRSAEVTFDRGAAVAPTRVESRSSEVLARRRRIAVSFERTGAAVGRTRFVLSASPLNDSYGPFVDAAHRPVVFEARSIENLDAPFVLEWEVVLPRHGACRVELDAFVPNGEGWRWVGNWRLPPSAWLNAPEVSVDAGVPSDVVATLPVVNGSTLEARPLDLDPKAAGTLVLEATARGGDGARVLFSQDGVTWDRESALDLPLIPDGRRHTYVIDLAAVDGWGRAPRIRGLRLDLGDSTRAAVVHAWRLARGRRLGAAADGTFRGPDGALRPLLSVDGVSVLGRRWVRAGRDLRITLGTPDPGGRPAPFLLLAKRGWPAKGEGFDLKPFDVPGRLCFRPHLVDPPGDRVMGVADASGLDPRAFAHPGPAPATFEVPLGLVNSGDTLVLQAVFFGEHPGVSNAVVLRVR